MHERQCTVCDVWPDDVHVQDRGIAEADPSLDVKGWDTANKLVLIANAVLNYPATLDDVTVLGIEGIASSDIAAAAKEGKVYRLVATATRTGADAFAFSVKPRKVAATSFLGVCTVT